MTTCNWSTLSLAARTCSGASFPRWPRRLRLHLAQRPFHRSEVHDVSDVAPFLARKEPDRFSAPASIDRCFCRTRMPAVALPFPLALDER
jgi:hypothetical protein